MEYRELSTAEAPTPAERSHKPGVGNQTKLVGAASVLGLQSSAGNRAVTRELARGCTQAVQRAPDPPRPRASYVAHPAALADCVGVLRGLYRIADVGTITDLRRFKTIAVGQVVAADEPEVGRLVWTANGKWNDPVISAALASLNATRWDPGQSKSTRGATGAPGDAEQRMLSHENDSEYVVKAMAVSRPMCADCATAVAQYGADNGRVLVAVVPPPDERELEARTRALAAVSAAAGRLRGQFELYSGEHQTEANLINSPSVTGFVGFWTNRLFNKDIPSTNIWTNTFGSLAAVDSSVTAGDIRRAVASLIRARRQFLLAQREYVAWKDGIEPAGQKAQIAIGVIALATIAAVVAPAAIAAAGSETGATAAAEQLAVRIAATVAQADATMLAAEAAMTEAELIAEAELEVELLLGL